MSLDEFIAALNAAHMFAISATDRPPASGGRFIVVSHSEYAEGGFSLTLSDGHPVIVTAVAHVVEHLGFEVQSRGYDPRMEAWPRRQPAAPSKPV